MSLNTLKPMELILKMLKEHEIDGETLEQLIKDLGMEYQMLRQLAMRLDTDILKQLIKEKEELETNKVQIYNIEHYTTDKVCLCYKNEEYIVIITTYISSTAYEVLYVSNEQEVEDDGLCDELIDYVEKVLAI